MSNWKLITYLILLNEQFYVLIEFFSVFPYFTTNSLSFNVHVLSFNLGIVKGTASNVTSKSGKKLNEDEISVRTDFESGNNRRHKMGKPAKTVDRTLLIQDIKEDSNEVVNGNSEEIQSGSWTQLQQKIFEKALALFPKGTSERFCKVAEQVPGKSKVSIIISSCC